MPGTLIVSLDFELFWGMLDCSTLEAYSPNVLGGREAIPMLLRLFREHGIHATWAAVGFMFAESKEELLRFCPPPELQPTYTNPALSPYPRIRQIGDNEKFAPCFYAPSLLRLIAEEPGQEIASHTFSHYYCREKGQTAEQFRADMKAALAIAADKGYSLKSVILPRNQCTPDSSRILSELGFTAYRDEENDWIHRSVKFRPLMRLLRLADVYLPLTGMGTYLPRQEDGLCNLMGSRMYKPIFRPLQLLEKLKLHRIKGQMKHAAKHNRIFHLWWHPHNIGVHTEDHLRQLQEILTYYDEMKATYGMVSLNMEEASSRFHP